MHSKHLIMMVLLSIFSFGLNLGVVQAVDSPSMTHGPILGQVTHNSIKIWARTSIPSEFSIRYGVNPLQLQESSDMVVTTIENDNTGYTTLTGLSASTTYHYQVFVGDYAQGSINTFRTLPSAEESRNKLYNPEGLFNFKFEIGCCANQNPEHGIGHSLPLYRTMLKEVAEDVDFSIMNGDWLYEEYRDLPVDVWKAEHRLTDGQVPSVVQKMPSIVGVWKNYQHYLSRGIPLAKWHQRVPGLFVFDDHELLNDLWGAGTAGRRHRRTVFRDIGTEAWYDYLGWANPTAYNHPIHYGTAEFEAGSNLLVDKQAKFTQMPLSEMSNLHVHWGTETAGVNDIRYDDDSGDPNSRVYDIVDVIDDHTVKLHMPAAATGKASYSIGRRSYGSFRVSNCHIFLLDTRSHRDIHDIRQPAKLGISILGTKQREWLLSEMQASDADFFFLVSSVPFMIPHSGAGGVDFDVNNKEEAWVVFLDEREKLIDAWDKMKQPVFVMTGDLHNSFAINITDNVWEFCCGPHNSVNHVPELDEADRPATGIFQSGPRQCDIRWSSYVLPDIPRLQRCYPYYCIVQVNNVFNMPKQYGGKRLVAYPHPQVIFQYYEGRTGKLAYAESVTFPHE